jgi:hypothetical protein
MKTDALTDAQQAELRAHTTAYYRMAVDRVAANQLVRLGFLTALRERRPEEDGFKRIILSCAKKRTGKGRP